MAKLTVFVCDTCNSVEVQPILRNINSVVRTIPRNWVLYRKDMDLFHFCSEVCCTTWKEQVGAKIK